LRLPYRPNLFKTKSKRGKLDGIDLDANGGLLLAEDEDLGHPADLGNLLRQNVIGVVVDFGDRQAVRCHCDDENGRVRRINLAEDRRAWKVARQLSAGGGNGCLDVLRGAIDIPIEIELKRYGRDAKGTGGRHLRDARDLGELTFERRRHRGRHGLRASPGKIG